MQVYPRNDITSHMEVDRVNGAEIRYGTDAECVLDSIHLCVSLSLLTLWHPVVVWGMSTPGMEIRHAPATCGESMEILKIP